MNLDKKINDSADLIFENEIRYGPYYFRLRINDKEIKNAIFGDSFFELKGGKYLAIEEWLTTNYQKGPITRVAIFDLTNELVAHLRTVEKGFVGDFVFESDVFYYTKYYGRDQRVGVEVKWADIIKRMKAVI